MKTLVLCHIPKDERFHAEVWLANLRRYPAASEVVLFGPGQAINIQDPSPQPDSRWYYQNLMWLTACRIALKSEATWMIYCETDCRVGVAGWDRVMMREAFEDASPDMAVAGSMVVCNPCNGGPNGLRRWVDVMARQRDCLFPVPAYGNRSIEDGTGSVVMVNGALGLYRMASMSELFPELAAGGTQQLARTMTAYDKEIGVRLWKQYGAGAYDRVRHLQSIYSCFGDVLTTEHERLNLLRDRVVVGVHAVKSRATV